VFVSLAVAPGLFALFALAMAVAMLVGQEMYLVCAMLLVPAGFVLTAIVIGVQGSGAPGKPDDRTELGGRRAGLNAG
jgi:hypothetical protein